MQRNRWARLGRDDDKGGDGGAGGGGKPDDAGKDKPDDDKGASGDKDVKQHSDESFTAIKDEKRKALERAEAAEAKVKEFEDAKLSKEDKLAKDHAEAAADRDSSKVLALKLGIALDKGLTRSQAMRLVGGTKEELEADADELVKDLGLDTEKPAAKLRTKPKENLKGGGRPDEEDGTEDDPRKLAAAMRASQGGLRVR